MLFGVKRYLVGIQCRSDGIYKANALAYLLFYFLTRQVVRLRVRDWDCLINQVGNGLRIEGVMDKALACCAGGLGSIPTVVGIVASCNM